MALAGAATASVGAELCPIVDAKYGYLFGASKDGKFIKPAKAAKALPKMMEYRLFSLENEIGRSRGAHPKSIEEPCPDVLSVEFNPKPDSTAKTLTGEWNDSKRDQKGEEAAVALAASWNPLPRKPRVQDPTQEVYQNAVRDFLTSRQIREPQIKITKIVRVDLDGDGEDEVLISATNYPKTEDEGDDDSAPIHSPQAGNYSFVLLRRVVEGKVRTQLVAGEVYAKTNESAAANVYQIQAVLDVDGDGKMEVIVHSFYYEGGESTIYRCEPAKVTPLLSVGCGV